MAGSCRASAAEKGSRKDSCSNGRADTSKKGCRKAQGSICPRQMPLFPPGDLLLDGLTGDARESPILKRVECRVLPSKDDRCECELVADLGCLVSQSPLCQPCAWPTAQKLEEVERPFSCSPSAGLGAAFVSPVGTLGHDARDQSIGYSSEGAYFRQQPHDGDCR